MDHQDEPRISALQEVTEAAFNGVLNALERRKMPLEKFPGPILIGIIAWPELRQLPTVGDIRAPGQPRE